MQIKKDQLQQQQRIMAHLGYYSFKCDGIWGPASIAAKQKWEQDSSFIPALPTNGLPFGERDPLPKKMYIERGAKLFSYIGMPYTEVTSTVEEPTPPPVEEPTPPPVEEPTPPPVEEPTPPPVEETSLSGEETSLSGEDSSGTDKSPVQDFSNNPSFKKKKKHR